MELIRYLEQRFLTREQLLDHCAMEAAQLERLQQSRKMPQASYRLRLEASCDSFFGQHAEQVAVDYYAKGYAAWLALATTFDSEDGARSRFFQRYRARLALLAAGGIAPASADFAGDAHLQSEWDAFLKGTYGLCTASGLPEDIAAKEAATAVIRELTEGGAAADRDRLREAVDLLDRAAAPFAPHEVARSSRRRWVDGVRAAYGFAPGA